jgi:hypothetical protein
MIHSIRHWILEHHWRFLFLVLALYCLTGCVESRKESSSHADRRDDYHLSGQVGIPITRADGSVATVPVPFEITADHNGSSDTSGTAHKTTTVDGEQLFKALLASQGLNLGAPAAPPLDMTKVAAGLVSVASTVALLVSQYRQIKFHQNDSAEGWAKALAPDQAAPK